MTETALAKVVVPKLTKDDLERAKAAVLDGTPLPESDPELMARAIAERVMNAESFEEATDKQDLDAWSNYLGVPVTIETFHLNPTSFLQDGQPSCYAIVSLVRMDDGESLVVSCGARNVLAYLLAWVQHADWHGNPVKLEEAGTGGEGKNPPLWIRAA
jgi:hypothetical protein